MTQQRPDDVTGAIPDGCDPEALDSHAEHRRRIFDELARSDDPLTREVGVQLRDGHMRPADIFRIPEYREHFAVDPERDEETLREAVSGLRVQPDVDEPGATG